MAKFDVNDRVRVSSSFFWAKGVLGTIATPPPQVLAISGPWPDGLTSQEKSALGVATVYWVSFDEPQLMLMAMAPIAAARFVKTQWL
jgi:hypothetical protein